MCTVTLHRSDATLLVTMNRDEARSRGHEVPPQHHRNANGTPWLAPHDSDKGGTWFAANGHGLVAAILNRYQDDGAYPQPPNPESRGGIIPALMNATSAREALATLTAPSRDLAVYPPFTLLLASPADAIRLDWRGTGSLDESAIGETWRLVTSSFFAPAEVLPWRQQAFDAWVADGAAFEQGIPAFHLYRPPGKESMAPLMSRDISATRSIVQAAVDRSSAAVTLRYGSVRDGNVDWAEFARSHVLPPRGSAAPE